MLAHLTYDILRRDRSVLSDVPEHIIARAVDRITYLFCVSERYQTRGEAYLPGAGGSLPGP
jgi:hypothetical protein